MQNNKCDTCEDKGFYISYDGWEQRCWCEKGQLNKDSSEWELIFNLGDNKETSND